MPGWPPDGNSSPSNVKDQRFLSVNRNRANKTGACCRGSALTLRYFVGEKKKGGEKECYQKKIGKIKVAIKVMPSGY